MITRQDLERARRCTSGADCPVHSIRGLHPPLVGLDVEIELSEWTDVSEALERAMPETWDAESSMSEIAGRWIVHMATTHGANCAGPHCAATAEVPAHVAAIRRMWANRPGHGGKIMEGYNQGVRDVIRDLAHELGIDLDE